MARNKNTVGKRYNVPAETLERARAEMRGEVASLPPEERAKAQDSINKTSVPKLQTAKKAPSFAKSARVPTQAELVEEYTYVTRELRTLALLAVSLLALIIVVSVVLPRIV